MKKVKRLLVLVLIAVAICNPDLAVAQERLEFDFWQAQYKLDDLIESRLDVRELSGELGLDYNLAVQLSYKFWDQQDAYNSQLENLSLETVKNFSVLEDGKLGLGLAVDYSKQTIENSEIDAFQLENKSLDLVLEFDKKIVERVNLFSSLNYGVYNNYQLFSSNLDKVIAYDSNYNYSIKTGLKFKVGPDLRAKVGYKLGQSSLTAAGEEVTINDYDLTDFSQLQHGLFLGLETKF
ncbi:MAG: hypothetical protein ACQERJ_04710 [Bacillota bacterium]